MLSSAISVRIHIAIDIYLVDSAKGSVTNGTSSGSNVMTGELMFGQYDMKGLDCGRLSAFTRLCFAQLFQYSV
jgi:hypothetical protein